VFPYYPRKAVEAAALLLKEHPRQKMTRLRLLKLLYLADRKSLAETCRPITGDSVVAMKDGPVLSKTYDRIKGNTTATDPWNDYICVEGRREIVLVADPGIHALCRYEVGVLSAIAAEWRHKSDHELYAWVHGGNLPEYDRNAPARGRKDISLKDILVAVNRGKLLNKILQDAHRQKTTEALFGVGAS